MDSEQNKQENFQAGRWSEDEQHKFIVGVMNFGKDWKQIEDVVKTRIGSQVRSHAQKFFLKISKILKMRKKLAKKGIKYVPCEIDQEFIERIKQEWITQNTPSEIISLLHQSEEILKQDKKKALKKRKKQPTSNQVNGQHSSSSFRPFEAQGRIIHSVQPQQPTQPADFKNVKNICSSIVEESYQESYFMHLMQIQVLSRRLNMDPLSTGYDFSGFIDFSKPIINNPNSNENRRKGSFHLLGEADNQEKLKHTLESFRNMTQE